MVQQGKPYSSGNTRPIFIGSITFLMPSQFSVTGSPLDSSGTIAITNVPQTANYVWAGPVSGGAASATFRSLVVADLPNNTVTGIPPSTDKAIVRWNGTTAVSVQSSNIIIDDSDNITGIKTLGIASGAVSSLTPLLNATQTWNNAAVAFTAIKLNIISSASATSSLLFDMQVGSLSKFQVNKSGLAVINLNTVAPNSPINANTYQINGSDVATVQIELDSYSFTSVYYGRRAQGTCASPTALTSALTITTFGALGHDGTAFTTGPTSSIKLVTNEAWSVSAHGTDMQLNATPAGTITAGEAMRVKFFGSNLNNPALCGGGITSSFPAWKRVSAGWAARLADDSADASITVAGLSASSPIITPSYTVATLPAATSGGRAFVTDALGPTFGSAVVGGGTVRIPVYADGSIWNVG